MSEIIPYNRDLRPYATYLRNNMTFAEKMLWSKIKSRQVLGLLFCRQLIIESYIVDFYCKPIKLAIELDGPIHESYEALNRDKNRDYVLNQYEISVLRFTNDQILNGLDDVLEKITNNCLQRAEFLDK